MRNNADVLQLFVVMAAAIFSPSMASLIGPYMLIIFAAAIGAMWSLGRSKLDGWKSGLFYFARIVLTAILLTVAIARLMAGFISSVEPDWLIAPVALIIGLIGDDWKNAGLWAMEGVKRVFKHWLGD